jgi:hypothetical protein
MAKSSLPIHDRLEVSSKNKFLGRRESGARCSAEASARKKQHNHSTSNPIIAYLLVCNACITCGVEVVFLLGAPGHSLLDKAASVVTIQ